MTDEERIAAEQGASEADESVIEVDRSDDGGNTWRTVTLFAGSTTYNDAGQNFPALTSTSYLITLSFGMPMP